ncbi:hypothetical protein HELRODRAFT_176160 [Helobdella robusta]|uniref:Uncharacterized protein n=1 Tax=Helobdella robusta TaxID=6412 RepID=T1FA83_HELRO|nr:hypothetical protein HELRODRAFT_176160 [Helobdella robusta]ESO00295.1 hypothetical protein HELRODRAFT_176160 [Helobdella robusta]
MPYFPSGHAGFFYCYGAFSCSNEAAVEEDRRMKILYSCCWFDQEVDNLNARRMEEFLVTFDMVRFVHGETHVKHGTLDFVAATSVIDSFKKFCGNLIWNSLPTELKTNEVDETVFRKRIRAHLWDKAFMRT